MSPDKPKVKKVTKASSIKEHAKECFNNMMGPLTQYIVSLPPSQVANEQAIREMINRRARMAISAAEAFYTNWEAVKGKYIEE